MSDIALQNQELIQISETEINGVLIKTVSARDLHSFLESKQDFSTWIKNRIEKYGFVENQDFVRFHKKMEANNVLPPIKGGFFYGVLLCLIA